MKVVRVGEEELNINEYFPHLSLYVDPFTLILNSYDLRDDGSSKNLGWTMDLFMDEYDLTVGNDTQSLKPGGGYWSSPNLLRSTYIWLFLGVVCVQSELKKCTQKIVANLCFSLLFSFFLYLTTPMKPQPSVKQLIKEWPTG